MRIERPKGGVYPSQWIRSAIESGWIRSSCAIADDQIQPNSLDLRISEKGFRVTCSFLPGRDGIASQLERLSSYEVVLNEQGFVLETDVVYIFQLAEELELPSTVEARANPKSTTGRLDVFTRVITENGTAFDRIDKGYRGKLFIEVVPRSFAIRVRPGDCLSQIRFQTGDPVLSNEETAELFDTKDVILGPDGLVNRSSDLRIESGVFLSVALRSPADKTIGYRAKKNSRKPIDLRVIGQAPIRWYWEWVRRPNEVILEPDEFYIFASRELVSLPPGYCAEMIPFDAGSGEVRTHYAGFFDSGFGYEAGRRASETASAVVLEVRNRDVPFQMEDGHQLFRLLFLRNTEPPDVLYGARIGSSYQSQRLKLSKHFGSTSEPEEGQLDLPFD
jgi:dCTP deaminase